MMKNIFSLLLLAAILSVFYGCEPKKGGNTGSDTDTTTVDTPPVEDAKLAWEKDGLKVYALEDSPKFPDMKLSLGSPTDGSVLEPGAASFYFDVEGFDLGSQTSDAEGKGLANSGKGQHIHLILNNGPYSAHYENKFDKELEQGHYVMLAFPSRSYHESVKNAGVVAQFTIGENVEAEPVDLTAPHMFYSRPKGKYAGKDTEKLLLDFFLVNTDLAADGNKVRATINGVEFMFDTWVPYIIEGLPMGEVSIKLELLDKDDNLVPSPYNPVERTVELVEEGMGMTSTCNHGQVAMK